MADDWRRKRPSSAAEIRRFYAETDHYVWELLGWNGSEVYAPYRRRLERLADNWPSSEHTAALDFGSGVGSAALALAESGYQVTIADVPGRTLEFARRRLERTGLPFSVVEVHDDVPNLSEQAWDVVVSFDVFEHLAEPARVARTVISALKPGGGAAIVASFDAVGDSWPHHLPSGRARFSGHRWPFYLQGLGLKHLGDDVYVRLGARATFLRRLQYLAWRTTGMRIERAAR